MAMVTHGLVRVAHGGDRAGLVDHAHDHAAVHVAERVGVLGQSSVDAEIDARRALGDFLVMIGHVTLTLPGRFCGVRCGGASVRPRLVSASA